VGRGGWNLSYHGYFHAPLRVGIGKRTVAQRVPPRIPPQSCTTSGFGCPADVTDAQRQAFGKQAYDSTTFHSPLLPDDQYVNWQHTVANRTDWAEMYFTVGNELAEGTLGIQGYNFTQGAYNDSDAQFGIGTGYITIHPELPWENVRVGARVGAFGDYYGRAGRYDAGEYDTYLFGRTGVLGGTLHQELDLGPITLTFEEGLGGKRPDPSQYNTAKFTLLGHLHGFLQYGGLTFGAHFLTSWAQEEDRDGQGCSALDPNGGTMCTQYWGGSTPSVSGPAGSPLASGTAGFGVFGVGAEGNVWLPDGHLNVSGVEVKYDAHPYGLFYLGWSNIDAKNALTVGPLIEVLHAQGGGPYGLGVTNNYLDNPRCKASAGECSSGGNGTVNSLLLQYEFSLMNLLKGLADGSRFWGEGMDFVAKLYGMYNKVNSRYSPQYDGSLYAANAYGGVVSDYWVRQGDNYSDYSKLKYGGDFYFHALPAMGVGLRADRLQPNSKIPEQGFTILSPRLEFRSTWLTHERITLQYSRYLYDQRECQIGPPSNVDVPNPTTSTAGYWGNWPNDQRCVQMPSAPRLPDGWGATQLDGKPKWRGAPVAGGNVNAQLPDVNVVKLEASIWW
jgi:hypothetical protein